MRGDTCCNPHQFESQSEAPSCLPRSLHKEKANPRLHTTEQALDSENLAEKQLILEAQGPSPNLNLHGNIRSVHLPLSQNQLFDFASPQVEFMEPLASFAFLGGVPHFNF